MTRIHGKNYCKQSDIRKQSVGAIKELYGRKNVETQGERNVMESQGRLHRAGDTGDRHGNVDGKSQAGKEKEALRCSVSTVSGGEFTAGFSENK